MTDGGRYKLLYGGTDSDGITDRARDVSSVMMGVAQSHALESSCPIVMKEFYLLPEEDRRLFWGIDTRTSPISEFGASFEIQAGSWDEKETLSLGGSLREGPTIVRLSYTNDFADEVAGDRNVALDRLDLRGSDGAVVVSQELEDLPSLGDCNHSASEHYALNCTGSLDVPVHIPAAGDYDIEVVVWADQAGDELPELEVAVGSDSERSTGSRKIKAKLVEFYERLHGVVVSVDSPEVSSAYALFVDVWNRKRQSEGTDFGGIDCHWQSDQYYLEGIVEDAFVYRDDWDWGEGYGWDDWERINAHFETIDWSDPPRCGAHLGGGPGLPPDGLPLPVPVGGRRETPHHRQGPVRDRRRGCDGLPPAPGARRRLQRQAVRLRAGGRRLGSDELLRSEGEHPGRAGDQPLGGVWGSS